LKRSRELFAVQAELELACVRLGFPMEGRAFAPHLTLGRVRDGVPPDKLRFVGAGLEKVANRIQTVMWRAEAITFFRSELKPTGAVYSAIHNGPFRSP
jgi:2'-5' RNA ligase